MKSRLLSVSLQTLRYILLLTLSACTPRPTAVKVESTASPEPASTETPQRLGHAFPSSRFSYSWFAQSLSTAMITSTGPSYFQKQTLSID
jgi:hypothetical protein